MIASPDSGISRSSFSKFLKSRAESRRSQTFEVLTSPRKRAHASRETPSFPRSCLQLQREARNDSPRGRALRRATFPGRDLWLRCRAQQPAVRWTESASSSLLLLVSALLPQRPCSPAQSDTPHLHRSSRL